MEFSTYLLETLKKDGEFILYRGRREDGSRILAVEPSADIPSVRSLERLEHEYSIKDELDPAWAAQPVALQRHGGRTMLLLRDPGGEPLHRLLGQPLELKEFLHLAIALAGALGQLHAAGLVHKNLRPENILVKTATAEVWLTGFGIASRLRRERQTPERLESLSTLVYIAPEQTGRMNRSIDSRSDLYSYGAILYQMLTGVLPFTVSEPMEWVHAHIARRPLPPRERVEQIPEVVSGIVMKLLAKASEERYQTAAGVEADLRKCLAALVALNRIEVFPLGRHDMSDRLLIPERLYGRDKESAALRQGFERVASSGVPEVILVSGYSGIGKSSVVNELQKAIVLRRGIFISGKFDQYKRDIPYVTFVQAFQSLMRQVLTGSDEEVAHWRAAIQEAAGPNGQLLVELIPELELIIGPQPVVPDLQPEKAQNRLHAVFRRFLAACAQEEHPLALFIDDLQWLDSATIELLEHLLTDASLRHFLLVGAYRDNEVTPAHPVMLMLDSIRQTGTAISEIELKPLSLVEMNNLLADALHCQRSEAEPLAQLVNEKTAGNPFFTIQFLSSLTDEHLLEFDALSRAWKWDLDRIRAKAFTENVVDLMIGKLQRLPFPTQEALKRLACLGNSAQTGILNIVQGGSGEDLYAELWEAVQAGFVLHLEGSYKFSHDRIQEAAYALIPRGTRAKMHLWIGHTLFSRMTPEEVNENIFCVVNQFNAGTGLITEAVEKERVAELNLVAAKKAKASGAYASTRSYLVAGMALVGHLGWKRCYVLALKLWLERAECEFLIGNFEIAEGFTTEALQKGRSNLDKVEAYRLRIQLCVIKTQNPEAIDIAMECLGLFGIEMPRHPTGEEVQAEYEEVWKRLEGRSIASLMELPTMQDPEMQAAMNVLSAIFVPAFGTDNNLFRLLVSRMVNVSLQFGTTEASTHCYVWFGLLLGPVFHRYEEGYQFGQLAVDLVEKYNFLAWKAKAFYVMEMVLLWTRPIADALEYARAAFRTGVEIGDLTYACYGSEHAVTNLLLRGDHLGQVWQESVKAHDFAWQARYQDVADIVLSIQDLIQHLRGQTPSFTTFDEGSEEGAFEADLTENGKPTRVCWYWILKLRKRFMSRDYATAMAAAQRAKALLWASECHIQLLDYYYYTALASAAFHDQAPSEGKKELWKLVSEHLEQLNEWAQNCPSTFRDKYILVAAELARIEDRDLAAMNLYDEAIQAADDDGFVQNKAIACELAAVFYLKRGFELIAKSYLREARNCYFRWGALGKVQQLDELYPSGEGGQTERRQEEVGPPVDQLDLVAVVGASQAVSSAIVLDKLIETLMVITVEHAGAERGLLVLLRNGVSQIKAEAITSRDKVEVHLRHEPITPFAVPESILNYVTRTGQKVILDDAPTQHLFSNDPYVQRRRPRSVLCLPIKKQGELMGLLYLENNLTPGAFTPERQAVLELLASQAAISLENARLYSDLRQENADRKKAEEALRVSEERWRKLFECSSVGIAVKDLDQQIIAANPAFQKMLGYTNEELQTLSPLAITEGEDRRSSEMNLADLTEEPPQAGHAEKRYRRKDGSQLWADVSAFFVPATENRPALFPAIVVDITERKLAEEALNRLNRTLQTVYQCNHALVHAADEQGLLNSICDILVKVGALRMAWVGYCQEGSETTLRLVAKAGEGVEYLTSAKNPLTSREERRDASVIALRTGKPYWVKDAGADPILVRCPRPSISRDDISSVALPLLVEGRPLGILHLYASEPDAFNESTIEQYTDLANNLAYGVTALRTREERQRAEEALRESEQRLQDVVDNTTAVVFVKDLDLRYVLVNREYERRIKVQREQVRGKTDFDIHPRPFAETARANDLRVIEAGEPIQFEETVPTTAGERHYVVVKFLLRDHRGKPYAICGIATDITDSKRAAEKVKEHSIKLAQANEVLKRSLNALARDKNLHSFVDQVLVVLTEQLGGHSSTLWLLDLKQRKGYLQYVCQDGQVIQAEDSDHPNARKPHEWPRDDPGWIALGRKRPFYDYNAVSDPKQRQRIHTAYLTAIGVKSLLWIPLVFAEQLIGTLTVRIAVDRQIDETEIEFAQALAQQVTLALELARLAEQAKQNALSVEREIATRERATELAKANEALLQCLDALASVSELDEFLGQVMIATTRQLNATSSVVRLRDFEKNVLTLDLAFQDGRVMTPAEAKYPEELQFIALDEPVLKALEQPTTVHVADDKLFGDVVGTYLRALGVKTLLIIPLTISRQLVGSLTFRFTEDREFRPEQIEFGRALASQAALAIQLTRLAKAARQSAVLAERNELAGEIHDSLAQFFTGISMQLGAAREVFKAGGASVQSYIERASDMAQFGLAEARRSAFSLQPSIIEVSGLIDALQKMVERSNIPGRLRCNFYSTGLPEESLPSSVQHELLRIAQEAMSNAVRHAKPTIITVNLRCNPPDLFLEVTDNGSGIADSHGATREGFGFYNMRARAENIGAQLEVRTAEGHGTTIVVRLPMI